MVKTMADKPIILALANPEPEIRPEDAKAARPDCIIATGRSDYPNQVNNVLCFPTSSAARWTAAPPRSPRP
jgi:malate dehydrogenase (oxaloacetate-decarboxylating)(NADP+)